MRDVPVVSGDGKNGVRYTLTVDGWANLDDTGCIHYGTAVLKSVDSYVPTGRKVNDAELYLVKATVVAKNLEPWATQPIVIESFPELAEILADRTITTSILKAGNDWIGQSMRGTPLTNPLSEKPQMPTERELLSVLHRNGRGTMGSSSICIRLPSLGYYDDQIGSFIVSYRIPFQPRQQEHYGKVTDYLDMLVSLGVATSRKYIDQNSKGRTQEFLEYGFSPEIQINGLTSTMCMEVASTSFELLNARQDSDYRVEVRGLQRARPLHDWVLHPSFLAAHPEIKPLLSEPQPVMSTISIFDGKPLDMMNWIIPSGND